MKTGEKVVTEVAVVKKRLAATLAAPAMLEMSPKYELLPGVVVFPREAVLTHEQVCSALQLSPRTVERLDIPCAYLGKRTRRYVWGLVLDYLAKRTH